MIQALWRGKVDRIAISERRAASKELQRLTRGRASRVEARSVRERTNAATVVAAQVRGFIDRQWVQMLRAEEVCTRLRAHRKFLPLTPRAMHARVSGALLWRRAITPRRCAGATHWWLRATTCSEPRALTR